MDIGAVMLVKNEVLRLEAALAPILDQLAQVVVFDTGSTDGTQDLLRERLGIEPIPATLDWGRCGSHADLRNRGLARLTTPWCMTLDADERIDAAELRSVRRSSLGTEAFGVFLCWRNFPENGEPFDDYKCVFFRRGVKQTGLIHDTVQPALRRLGATAVWSDEAVLEHRPEARKDAWKRETYGKRLRCAMEKDPANPRYPWFAGYSAFCDSAMDHAQRLLTRAAESKSVLYPVERLNARVVLTAVAAKQGDRTTAQAHLTQAETLFARVRGDFEIRVNHWIESWLDATRTMLAEDALSTISPPRFAY